MAEFWACFVAFVAGCGGSLSRGEQAVATEVDDAVERVEGLRSYVEGAVKGDCHAIGCLNKACHCGFVNRSVGAECKIINKPNMSLMIR